MEYFSDIYSHVGVSEEVIKRAAYVLDAIGNDEHIERLPNVNISAQDQQYKVPCSVGYYWIDG